MANDDVIKDFLDEAGGRMKKSVEATRAEFSTVRTGRASPHLLDRIEVDYYGATTPLKQLAQVSATEARLLTITPYDKNSIKTIEKAILESDGIAEQGRVGVRNIRRDVMHDLRELKNEGEVGSDDEHRAETELQKLTDSHIGDIDGALAGKEEEILEV